MELIDSFGRRINYLRLSVTDRCNLRCSYCMPAEGVEKLAHGDILSYEDLFRIARAAVAIGIEKIRITGGEPLVRKGIVPFLARIAAIEGLRQLVLTTNGLLLPEMAADLRSAGVQRLNISLDSLRADTFRAITRIGELQRVLDGIAAADAAGFPPPKINMVVMRGVNDGEVADFARLTIDRPCTVRFIEYMPATRENNWQSLTVPGREILDRISASYELEPVEKGACAGPSRDFRIRGAAGTLGVITAVSGHFCGDCNRVRVTSTGMAKSCLFSDEGFDLRPFLETSDPIILQEALRRIVGVKPERHGMSACKAEHQAFSMAKIGG
ncbi:GTP 3',8-cyclase MoaA [Geobacter sulfurreducens]|jgi:cyclic pyranopterin phosphate synthase|uniref:GTP 3',8-cyclase n=1 Tax=Geobacter sulfurreducens (strain ATCC 51573 / DSM 12127 / PCA) TaxID=243231 RepID=MOAA_GEOSL|nr:GTP 3',8-cyclase MoaA [Geobacter sulfurreducens]Q747W9.1 RecName: Full=GTP 3',8-cyclase; AltName: Full=Molybdenum cofactor biosynthesis protein A [Geobacter sulfurreducens PCA]AAR36537.1 pyranopterin triphosphate synthase [Geobacter sulfurreducens PCA]ADI85897.1 pyranopterin triphosphate synthase [Geobacter sulfurreducens KN400]AJY69386.1 molybdenum cofactor biosynthesis protein MoeA [Geobacter sulfurreducens]QVW34939.1 GTP 3',8-cyclase MoaA [Geobacter sulfurreducens]UAC03810.1 GTP 3',8-cy